MTLKIDDRLRQTTTGGGVGSLNLIAPATGDRAIAATIGDGNTFFYVIDAGTGEWEIGKGTIHAGNPDTMSRDTVLSSSNANALVNFSAGTKTVVCDLPASKRMWTDDAFSAGDVPIFDGAKFVKNTPTGTGAIVRAASPTFSGQVGIGGAAGYPLHIYAGSPIVTFSPSAYAAGPNYYRTQLGTTAGAEATLLLGNAGFNEIRAGSSIAGGYLDIFVNNTTYIGTNSDGTRAVRFASDGSVLFGTTSNGGWDGAAKVEIRQSSANAIAFSAYNSTNTGGAIRARVDNPTPVFAAWYYSTSMVGSVSVAGGGTGASYNTTSTEEVKDSIVHMDSHLALKVVRAYEPKSYRHKRDRSDGHGFVVEHFYRNMKLHGLDAQSLGLVHFPSASDRAKGVLPGMDYGKATPFLACVLIKHEDRIASLEAELIELKKRGVA